MPSVPVDDLQLGDVDTVHFIETTRDIRIASVAMDRHETRMMPSICTRASAASFVLDRISHAEVLPTAPV